MSGNFYIKLFRHVKIKENQLVTLGDIASCFCDDETKDWKSIPLLTVKTKKDGPIVLDILEIVKKIEQNFSDLSIQVLGHTEMVLEVIQERKPYHYFIFFITWLLLFVGAGVAIIYFHEDVSMHQVHELLYYVLTGQKSEHHLLFSIPYSLGLGLGMVLFYNHLFKKSFDAEPSPLEIEMLQYQQSVDNFLVVEEGKKHNDKKP